jgi:SAM-dependent methyltransferase
VSYSKLAELYDRIFPDEGFYRAYGRMIARLCRTFGVRPKRTLDAACGTGRLARYLPGLVVEGMDASAPMRRIASKRLRVRAGTLYRLPAGGYDLVTCTFDSLNHLPKGGLVRAFRAARQALAPGGLYCFDLNSDFRINQVCPSYLGRRFRIGACEVFWLSRTSRDRWESSITIFERGRGGRWRRFEERIVETAFSLAEIRAALRRARLRLVGEFGDTRLGPIRPDGERWFFAARRDDGSRD